MPYINENTAHSPVAPHTIDSHFAVFSSDIWYKIYKSLKYYEYQLSQTLLRRKTRRFQGFFLVS